MLPVNKPCSTLVRFMDSAEYTSWGAFASSSKQCFYSSRLASFRGKDTLQELQNPPNLREATLADAKSDLVAKSETHDFKFVSSFIQMICRSNLSCTTSAR